MMTAVVRENQCLCFQEWVTSEVNIVTSAKAYRKRLQGNHNGFAWTGRIKRSLG